MRSVPALFLGLALISACGGNKEAPAAAPSGPIVGALELPISLRSKASAPAGAGEIEISPTEVHFAAHPVLTLNAGAAVAPADRQGEQIPKLAAALSGGAHAAITMTVGSGIPYETVALVLNTAKAAGANSVAFQVRPPGGTSSGYLALDALDVRPKAKNYDEIDVPGASKRPWGDFVSQWEAVQNGCRGSQTGSCAFKPETVADGGDLKIVLHSAGQGVNVEFFRIGPEPQAAPPKEEAPDAKGKKGKAAKGAKAAKGGKKKKVEMLDGVPAPKDVVDEALNAPPATEALFQFRAQEAVTSPSAVTETMKPVCGSTPCTVVVTAEKATLFVRVISLLGAAFPDGVPTPRVVFEVP